MIIQLVRSKIHRAAITQADLHYEGSLAIDQDLLDEANMYAYEKILVVNMATGSLLEKYAIPADRGSRVFCLNGAAARLGTVGDRITIMSFGSINEEEASSHKPTVIVLDEDNEIIQRK